MELEKRILELLDKGLEVNFRKSVGNNIRISMTKDCLSTNILVDKKSNYFDALKALEMRCDPSEEDFLSKYIEVK
jgi:hypothetical protein